MLCVMTAKSKTDFHIKTWTTVNWDLGVEVSALPPYRRLPFETQNDYVPNVHMPKDPRQWGFRSVGDYLCFGSLVPYLKQNKKLGFWAIAMPVYVTACWELGQSPQKVKLSLSYIV